jgi:hypothetical protein
MQRRSFAAPGGGAPGGLPVTAGSNTYDDGDDVAPIRLRKESPIQAVLHWVRRKYRRLSYRPRHDGSAAGIHLDPVLVKNWKRSGAWVRGSWICAAAFFLSAWSGWRWIRYSHASFYMNCQLTRCTVRMAPPGWDRPATLELNRRQVVAAYAVRSTRRGEFVSANPPLTDPYVAGREGKKNAQKKSSYKGPDDEGNYVSFAVVFRDADKSTHEGEDDVELEPVRRFLQVTEDKDREIYRAKDTKKTPGAAVEPDKHISEEFGKPKPDVAEYRWIARTFRLAHSKRKVRTLTQKIDSYVRHRRQRLTVKETSAPAWQGIVLLIVGLCGFLLTCIVGQFREEPLHHGGGGMRGPGARRSSSVPEQRKQERLRSARKVEEPYQRQIPAAYEVQTQSRASVSLKSDFRRNETTASRRRKL